MAARTQVVVTTVGPYNRYGMPLVAACAAAGTDYADLTDEAMSSARPSTSITSRPPTPAPGSCTAAGSIASPPICRCTRSTARRETTAPAS